LKAEKQRYEAFVEASLLKKYKEISDEFRKEIEGVHGHC
jgi:hypothetical protein